MCNTGRHYPHSPFVAREDRGEAEWGEQPLPEAEAEQTKASPGGLRARILWPALGFPAVIAPRKGRTGSPVTDSDCTRCITLLVLSNRETLTKEDASRYLRYVPWAERGRRHIPAGGANAFREEQLAVPIKLTFAGPADDRS